MTLKTKVFEFRNRNYTNLSKLAQAMGISVNQIYRVRQGKRGVLKAFPGHKLDDLFHVAPNRSQND